MADSTAPSWQGRTDGTTWMHRWLIQSLKVLPLGFVYLGAELFVVPVYMVVGRQGFNAQYHFFRRRLGMGSAIELLTNKLNTAKCNKECS